MLGDVVALEGLHVTGKCRDRTMQHNTYSAQVLSRPASLPSICERSGVRYPARRRVFESLSFLFKPGGGPATILLPEASAHSISARRVDSRSN